MCPGCSCLCDGLTNEDGIDIPVEANACHVGSNWFGKRLELTSAREGSSVSDSLVDHVASLLDNAKFPLITGIENLTTQAQQAAVKVAGRFNAGIDSGWNEGGYGSMLSFQRYGKVTATLGEITSRSDLVVFWYCDPEKTHPRFIQKFLRCENAVPKRMVVIDQESTATASLADEFIHLPPCEAIQYARTLRRQLFDLESVSDVETGLIHALVGATYGSVFVGKHGETDPAFDVATDQWFQLVRNLNDHTRFVMGSLPTTRNGVGAHNVLASLCGFPNAVRFTDAGPIHNGLEYATASILKRRQCDLLLVCDAGAYRPFEAGLDEGTLDWLAEIPVIVLSDIPANEYRLNIVHVPVGVPGWSAEGDFVRCDDVPIPMDAIVSEDSVSMTEFFESVFTRA